MGVGFVVYLQVTGWRKLEKKLTPEGDPWSHPGMMFLFRIFEGEVCVRVCVCVCVCVYQFF